MTHPRLTTLRADLLTAFETVARLEDEVATLRSVQAAGGDVVDLVHLQGQADAAKAKQSEASTAREQAVKDAHVAYAKKEWAEERHADGVGLVSKLRAAIGKAEAGLRKLETAPCRAASDWISAKAADSHPEPVDLCRVCPFVAAMADSLGGDKVEKLRAKLADAEINVARLAGLAFEADAANLAAKAAFRAADAAHQSANIAAFEAVSAFFQAKTRNAVREGLHRLPEREAKLAEARAMAVSLAEQIKQAETTAATATATTPTPETPE